MFGDRQARFRSYQVIGEVAEDTRLRGGVSAYSRFNVVDFIIGPLSLLICKHLKTDFYASGDYEVPAFVNFLPGDKVVELFVEKDVWIRAKAGFAKDRYILAHEIGHILLHSHKELAYSASIPSMIRNIEPSARTEPQADQFADIFLVPDHMLDGFSSADEISEYFDVPIECAERRFFHWWDIRRRLGSLYTGDACPECANFTLVRNGTCLKCDTCGSTTGCS